MITQSRFLTLLAVALVASAGSSLAATLSGTTTPLTAPNHLTDFDAIGAIDWAYWETSATSVATNQRSGADLISTISAVNGGAVTGSTSATRPITDFSFSDGTSPVAATVTNVRGAFNNGLDTAGRGVSVNVMLPTTDTYAVYLWGAAFNGTGQLTASLPGAAPFVDATFTGGGTSVKDSVLYTFTVTPDTANDSLNLSFILSGDAPEPNSHVLINGVAVSPVPEPGKSMLLLFGLAGSALHRRRPRS